MVDVGPQPQQRKPVGEQQTADVCGPTRASLASVHLQLVKQLGRGGPFSDGVGFIKGIAFCFSSDRYAPPAGARVLDANDKRKRHRGSHAPHTFVHSEDRIFAASARKRAMANS